ncbi:MAG: hypothetical protein IPG50_15060 [Myxococcales bacterium]|nr:hypothetical protein [Myxococcales bacterium]
MKIRGAVVSLCALALFACKPKDVTDAEAKGDIGYLTTNGSPEAVAALGRLADKNPKARTALETRAEMDLNAYIAAWSAVQRGAPWGAEVLRSGLKSPIRAEIAAAAMARGDAKLADFSADLVGALVAAGTKEPRVTVAAMLASTPAADVIDQRLRDKTTRGNMCRGLASPDASAAARGALLAAAAESRDDPACVDSVVRLATLDAKTMAWLADSAEPGLLAGAGKSDAMPCPRLAEVWARAFRNRPPPTQGGLAVPLSVAIKRCSRELDPAMETALAQTPTAAALIVGGVEPYAGETKQLVKTCKALAGPAARGLTGRTRDRAADAVAHGCKGVLAK